MSNVYKHLGVTAKQGFLLGIQEAAAAQHVDWQSWITLAFLDTRSDKAHSLRLAKDAIADGAKAILGCTASNIGLALRDYALDKAGVPFIVFAGCPTEKLRAQHPLFIRTSLSVPLRPTVLARWLKAHPLVPGDQPRWACIHMDSTSGVGTCEAFQRAYGQAGEEIGRVPSPVKTVNKKREIIQLTKLKPDFALIAITGAEAGIFFRDYYRFKVQQKIPPVALYVAVLPDRLRTYEKTLKEHDTAVGLLTASAYEPVIDNEANQHFVARYQEKYNGKLPDALAMWGYDGGRLLIRALVQLDGKWDGHKVVELMKTLPYTSPRHGAQLRFDTHGDPINPAHIQKTERDGDRLVNTIIDQVAPVNMDTVLK